MHEGRLLGKYGNLEYQFTETDEKGGYVSVSGWKQSLLSFYCKKNVCQWMLCSAGMVKWTAAFVASVPLDSSCYWRNCNVGRTCRTLFVRKFGNAIVCIFRIRRLGRSAFWNDIFLVVHCQKWDAQSQNCIYQSLLHIYRSGSKSNNFVLYTKIILLSLIFSFLPFPLHHNWYYYGNLT